MLKQLKPYLWITPFLSFLFGYGLLQITLSSDSTITPQLIGTKVDEALNLLAPKNLNLRIVGHKEDKDLEEGIILSQTPHYNQNIKPQQQIFVVVSKKPPKIEIPSVVGLTLVNAQKKIEQLGLSHKIFTIQTQYPHDTIIAQIPVAHDYVDDHKMMSYVSAGTEKAVLFPDLKGKLVSEVTEFLHAYGIAPQIYHLKPIEAQHTCITCKVMNQKPLPGSFVYLNKPISVQLEI